MVGFTEKTDAEKAVDDLQAAADSVKLINDAVTAGVHDENIDSNVEANWKHLEIVLKRQYIIADTSDKSAINAAITAGKAFYTSPAA